MSKTEGRFVDIPGLKHQGTVAFGNRVTKRRKNAKASKQARRRNRK